MSTYEKENLQNILVLSNLIEGNKEKIKKIESASVLLNTLDSQDSQEEISLDFESSLFKLGVY